MKKYDISVPKTYTSNNEEKVQWRNAGTLIIFEETAEKKERIVLELNMFPNTSFVAFEQKAKERTEPKDEPPSDGLTSPDEDGNQIDVNDIPF